MASQIKIRRGTAAQWTSSNPVLAAGEPGFETDTRKIKYGDGSQAWNTLSYSYVDAASTTFSPPAQNTPLFLAGAVPASSAAGFISSGDNINSGNVFTPAGNITGTFSAGTGLTGTNVAANTSIIDVRTASITGTLSGASGYLSGFVSNAHTSFVGYIAGTGLFWTQQSAVGKRISPKVGMYVYGGNTAAGTQITVAPDTEDYMSGNTMATVSISQFVNTACTLAKMQLVDYGNQLTIDENNSYLTPLVGDVITSSNLTANTVITSANSVSINGVLLGSNGISAQKDTLLAGANVTYSKLFSGYFANVSFSGNVLTINSTSGGQGNVVIGNYIIMDASATQAQVPSLTRVISYGTGTSSNPVGTFYLDRKVPDINLDYTSSPTIVLSNVAVGSSVTGNTKSFSGYITTTDVISVFTGCTDVTGSLTVNAGLIGGAIGYGSGGGMILSGPNLIDGTYFDANSGKIFPPQLVTSNVFYGRYANLNITTSITATGNAVIDAGAYITGSNVIPGTQILPYTGSSSAISNPITGQQTNVPGRAKGASTWFVSKAQTVSNTTIIAYIVPPGTYVSNVYTACSTVDIKISKPIEWNNFGKDVNSPSSLENERLTFTTYEVSKYQSVVSSNIANPSVLTVSNISSGNGNISAGAIVTGTNLTDGTYITSQLSGVTSGNGTYILNQAATGTPTTTKLFFVNTSQLTPQTTIYGSANATPAFRTLNVTDIPANLTYTPNVAVHWTIAGTAPTTIAGALDQLARRLYNSGR